MEATHPLVSRELTSLIAYLARPIPSFGLAKGGVDVRTFLHHVECVSDELPDSPYVINMCANRYIFMVTFCAVIKRGKTNLLPPNKNKLTQVNLAESYPGSVIVHDGVDTPDSVQSLDITQCGSTRFDAERAEPFLAIPVIADNHLACISFTSGSTGQSKPNLKFWNTLHQSSAINFQHMIGNVETTLYQLATMPAQHMWGLETSVLLPMFYDVCLCDAQPLFPQDIVDLLLNLPSPTLLVSTPVHLRALMSASPNSIQLAAVLCATSPLTPELAATIESTFDCQLREVYGCSEVGSMAVRRTAQQREWRRFSGITFSTENDVTTASANHLPEAVELQDQIRNTDDQHFELCGRTTDLIKIAGKRGSLYAINQVLLKFEGLKDGIIIRAETSGETTRPHAVVALSDNATKAELLQYLRDNLDSAFVPRPIYVVDELPRESNGKLAKARLNELLNSLRR